MWAYNFNWSTSLTISTGVYVLSQSTTTWSCSWYANCYVTPNWNTYSDFKSMPQSSTFFCTDYYTEIGQYGFCDQQNGNYQTPSQITSIQGLMVSSTVFLFISTVAACAGFKAGSKAGMVSVLFAFISFALLTASFSMMASWGYYQTFRSGYGGYLPVVTNNVTNPIALSTRIQMWWGPAFSTTIIAAIIAFFATCAMAMVSRDLDDDLDGTNYDAGAGAGAGNFEQTGQGMAGTTNNTVSRV